MNRHDLILTVWLLLFFCLLPFVILNTKKEKSTDKAIVKVDGNIIEYLDLTKDSVTEIETSYGHNTVCIENGEVYVSDSDCYGKDCVNYGKISGLNKQIICLPHHLVVYIQGDKNGADAVSY